MTETVNEKYEFDPVFAGISDNSPILEPSEVCDFEYAKADVLSIQIKKSPENYTLWFK